MSKKPSNPLGEDKELDEMRKAFDKMFGPIEDVNYDDLFESARHVTEQYNQDLRSRAKSPEQLTLGLECTVMEAHGYQGSTSVSGEWREGTMQSFSSGHTYRTEIKVESGTLVEKLEFKGWPPL